MGGGGGFTTLFYTFLHYTFAIFFVWCSKKCSKKGTLNYTFLHQTTLFTLNYTFFQNLLFSSYFPISFHIPLSGKLLLVLS